MQDSETKTKAGCRMEQDVLSRSGQDLAERSKRFAHRQQDSELVNQKPRLRMKHGLWHCTLNNVSAVDISPEQAYRLFKRIFQ